MCIDGREEAEVLLDPALLTNVESNASKAVVTGDPLN
jgi:hypothetical protein